MIIKLGPDDIKLAIREYLDLLVYEINDMDVTISVSADTEVSCFLQNKTDKFGVLKDD